MSLTRAVPAILLNDSRRLLRDRFLIGMGAYLLICAVALRWVVPWLEAQLFASLGFTLGPYVPMGVSYFVLVNASVLTGMVGGFLLLEIREECTVRAVLVTPTPLAVHLVTLAAMILLAGTLVALVESPIIGVGVPPWSAVLVSSALAAPTGIVFAFFLSTAAANKVEAFAMLKITTLMGVAPVAAFFLPEPYQYMAGVAPPYWACKIWWEAAAGATDWGWLVVPGVVVSAAWITALALRFVRVAPG